MDESSLFRSKLDPILATKINENNNYEILKVIIQTEDGLTDSDHSLIKSLGGKVKDDLYIINAFSADINPQGLKKLILSPRIVRVFEDGKVSAL